MVVSEEVGIAVKFYCLLQNFVAYVYETNAVSLVRFLFLEKRESKLKAARLYNRNLQNGDVC